MIEIFFVDSKKAEEEALARIRKSKFLAFKVSVVQRKYSVAEKLMLSIRTDNAFMVLMLSEVKKKHLDNFLRGMREAVSEKRIFMRDQYLLNELTMPIFSFSNLVDVDDAAESLGWKDLSWQGFSQKLTGGPMCNRAKSLP